MIKKLIEKVQDEIDTNLAEVKEIRESGELVPAYLQFKYADLKRHKTDLQAIKDKIEELINKCSYKPYDTTVIDVEDLQELLGE